MSGACIELHVHSYAGAEVALPALRLGGAPQSIGRSPGCHLSLDDPERLISRSHLQVWMDPGRGVVVRNSSSGSPAFIDGEELAPGQTASLSCGQRLMLGRYLLAVRESVSDEPGSPIELPAPASSMAPVLGEPPVEPALATAIPDSFDVFAAPTAGSAGGESAAPELSQILGAQPLGEDLFEDMQPFDARGPRTGLEGADPMAPPVDRGVASDILDLVAAPEFQLDAVRDGSAGELDAMFALPRGAAANTGLLAGLDSAADPQPAAPAGVASTAATPPEPAAADLGRPARLAVDAPPSPLLPAAPAISTVPEAARAQAQPRQVGREAAGGAGASSVPDSVLSAAFARGCGLPEERLDGLDAAAMEALGRTFAALVCGALQLIHARSSTKHELRANVTIIASSGNNPLKFAPDTQAALMQLLGRGLPGFMGPEAAVADAFDDLRAHQVGLLSASRAALYAMGQRLSPEAIQASAGGPRGFSGLLPSAHKARLWDHYVASHGALLGEAREEFEAVFQQAFVQAYEGEVERLQGGGRG